MQLNLWLINIYDRHSKKCFTSIPWSNVVPVSISYKIIPKDQISLFSLYRVLE